MVRNKDDEHVVPFFSGTQFLDESSYHLVCKCKRIQQGRFKTFVWDLERLMTA